MAGLKLSEIWIYPVKSFGGIRVKSAKVQQKGLQYDRRWMLVTSDGTFMTQRVYPQMALFKTRMVSDGFIIDYKGDYILLPFDYQPTGTAVHSQVWDDPVETIEADPSYNEWFSERIGLPCRLVYFPEVNQRLVDAKYRVAEEHVSLADGYPFLIIGQRSLDELNTKLSQPVPMNRFRPNFVFTGGLPHEEDHWRHFKIGNNRFIGVKPCSRCVLTTIDQQTALAGKEPLATLATYRKSNNKIYFGQNLLAVDHEEVYEGDEIALEA